MDAVYGHQEPKDAKSNVRELKSSYTGVREVWWKVALSLGWLERLASRISNPGETPTTVR
jgi:hypothetical protein